MLESLPLLSPVWWNWYLAGIVFLLLELVVPGRVVMWFGLGALAAGFITELFGGLHGLVQFVLFFSISILAMLSARNLLLRPAPPRERVVAQRLQRYLGRQAPLRTAIENGSGRIRLDGSYWTVKGPNLPVGTIVEIIDVEGSTLVVGKADTNIR